MGLPISIRIETALKDELRRRQREFRKQQKKRVREAANVVRKQARSEVAARFPKGTGRLKKAIKTSVRSQGLNVTARVGPKPGSLEFAYGAVHERGGRVWRRRTPKVRVKGASRGMKTGFHRSGRKPHMATYKRAPFMAPAVRKTAKRVYDMIGLAFKALG